MQDCIFCKIVSGEIPCVKVYEDSRVLAFEDINPMTDGHTLIVPKTHAEDIWTIEREDLLAVHAAAQTIAGAVRTALDAEGIAFLQLNGAPAKQMVLHYHLHLLPRLPGSPEIPVTSWEIKEGDMERIRSIGEKIAAALG
jgi:histidine triad (HIT) family protein